MSINSKLEILLTSALFLLLGFALPASAEPYLASSILFCNPRTHAFHSTLMNNSHPAARLIAKPLFSPNSAQAAH